MRHVLLIRPLEDALPMALELKSKGIESSLYPLFSPEFLPIPVLKNPQALVVTSKNGVRAVVNGLLAASSLRELPLYTVGDKTAEFAKQHGFLNILNASGASADLLQLILKTAHPEKGTLWHLSGREVKEDIVELLKIAGFEAQRQIVYKIADVTALPSALCIDLKNQKFSHVIFCSPRTTNVFVNLLKKLKFEKISCQISALCLSQEIGKKASSLKWKELWISPRPNVNDLMRYFDEER